MKQQRLKFLAEKFRVLILIILISITPIKASLAQSTDATTASIKNNKLLFCNAAIGMVSGAIGVAINDRNASLKDILLRGGAQGVLGGSIVHLGKKHINVFANSGKTTDFGKSKLIFSVGNSIMENAANDKRFYESIRLEYLFGRLEFDFVAKKIGLGINYSELLSNSITRAFERRHFDIDWTKSLSYGILISSDHIWAILGRV